MSKWNVEEELRYELTEATAQLAAVRKERDEAVALLERAACLLYSWRNGGYPRDATSDFLRALLLARIDAKAKEGK